MPVDDSREGSGHGGERLLEAYASGRRDFSEANLRSIDLSGADLRNACLPQADFGRATLVGIDLRGADLTRASFVGANLVNANLTESKGLAVAALAKSRLLGARLPTELLQAALTAAESASQAVRLPLSSIVLACVYFLLALASTKDRFLLTNALDWQMPVVETKVGVKSFYQFAPFVLVALYLYVHLSLQVLWEELSDLPAEFPDGRKLYRVVVPWAVNGMLTTKNGGPDRGLTALAQRVAFIALAWALVPVTICLAWARYLCVHDPWGTGAHVGALAFSVGFGMFSYVKARLTLNDDTPHNLPYVSPDGRLVARTLPLVATVAVMLAIVSHGQINGFPLGYDDQHWQRDKSGVVSPGVSLRLVENECRKRWPVGGVRQILTNVNCDIRRSVPWLLAFLGSHGNLDLQGAAVSQRPAKQENQCGPTSEIARLDLTHTDMRYANASDVFLANADLSGAQMIGANLSGAVLCDTSFVGNDVFGTNLVGVDFRSADLRNVDFERADLSGANFGHAVLTGARFLHARIDKADFSEATLDARCIARALNPQRARLTKQQLKAVHQATEAIVKDDLSFERNCGGRIAIAAAAADSVPAVRAQAPCNRCPLAPDNRRYTKNPGHDRMRRHGGLER